MENNQQNEFIVEQTKSLLSQIANIPSEQIQLQHTLADDLGIDSIQLLEMFEQMEKVFEIQLGVDDFNPSFFHSVQSFISFVQMRKK
ncbi:acyl carrier protein [Longirhabdus pacifica]|uniref:acyl carrier protein n=1 Tax=Longirhabdus pacifica TaxID=2305227 RepID=UPI0013E8DB31|nr:acyl carrier protein [Longirhabdus pacifica]